MRVYTGVGSRSTPIEILEFMYKIAVKFARLGYVLRSGGAKGADSAFERGCDSVNGEKRIFLARDSNSAAMKIAESVHPAWGMCSEYARELHARNAFQVLGYDLHSKSNIVICWTPDGCLSHETRSIRTGGTGTAISIASINNIRICNLADKSEYNKAVTWLNS